MAEAEHFESEEQLDELMKEAQNILTEQDPPVIYYGQRGRLHRLGPTSRASSRIHFTSIATTSTDVEGFLLTGPRALVKGAPRSRHHRR